MNAWLADTRSAVRAEAARPEAARARSAVPRMATDETDPKLTAADIFVRWIDRPGWG